MGVVFEALRKSPINPIWDATHRGPAEISCCGSYGAKNPGLAQAALMMLASSGLPTGKEPPQLIATPNAPTKGESRIV